MATPAVRTVISEIVSKLLALKVYDKECYVNLEGVVAMYCHSSYLLYYF